MPEAGTAAGRVRAAVDDAEDVLGVMWELFPRLRADLRELLDERDEDARVFAEWVSAVDGSDEERAAALLAVRIAGRIEGRADA